MIRIAEKNETEKLAMRDAYCATLLQLASENQRIVVLDSDLMQNSVFNISALIKKN